MAVVERWPLYCREVLNKIQCMDLLSAGTKKSGLCREVAISGGSTVFSFIISSVVLKR